MKPLSLLFFLLLTFVCNSQETGKLKFNIIYDRKNIEFSNFIGCENSYLKGRGFIDCNESIITNKNYYTDSTNNFRLDIVNFGDWEIFYNYGDIEYWGNDTFELKIINQLSQPYDTMVIKFFNIVRDYSFKTQFVKGIYEIDFNNLKKKDRRNYYYIEESLKKQIKEKNRKKICNIF